MRQREGMEQHDRLALSGIVVFEPIIAGSTNPHVRPPDGDESARWRSYSSVYALLPCCAAGLMSTVAFLRASRKEGGDAGQRVDDCVCHPVDRRRRTGGGP